MLNVGGFYEFARLFQSYGFQASSKAATMKGSNEAQNIVDWECAASQGSRLVRLLMPLQTPLLCITALGQQFIRGVINLSSTFFNPARFSSGFTDLVSVLIQAIILPFLGLYAIFDPERSMATALKIAGWLHQHPAKMDHCLFKSDTSHITVTIKNGETLHELLIELMERVSGCIQAFLRGFAAMVLFREVVEGLGYMASLIMVPFCGAEVVRLNHGYRLTVLPGAGE